MPLACPVCNTASNIEFQTWEADIYRCPACQHCFSDVKETHREGYSNDYFSEAHKNWFENPNYRLFEKICRIIMRHNPNSSVLDVGCGNGDFLRYLKKKKLGGRLTGIDLHENAPIEGIEFIDNDFFTIDFDRQFDAVVSLATIEHINNIVGFMQKTWGVCKPGGLVILMTVNDGGIIYALSRFFHRLNYPQIYNRLYSSHHLNHFNIFSLKKLIELSGLTVIKTMRHNYPLRAVDMGEFSFPLHHILLSGVAIIFLISKITGRTYLQTVVSRK